MFTVILSGRDSPGSSNGIPAIQPSEARDTVFRVTTNEAIRGGPARLGMSALRREFAQPLFRNAYALMLNTVVNSGLGLLYWVFAAHEFTEDEVGRGNALISLMVLVSTLTQLNFSGALMRFLPRSGSSSKPLLVAAYGVSGGIAVLGAAVVMGYCHFARDPGDPLYASVPFGIWFVIATAAWSLFNLQDSALTGLHASTWIPLENGLYGLVKLILLIVVARTSLVEGVFTSWTLPVIALLVPVNLLIFRRLLPRHATEGAATQDPPSRTVLRRYMTGDYAGTVFRQLSSTFLPVLVVVLLGAAEGAYFLPTQTIFTAIATLQVAITSSLVVEAASKPGSAARYARSMLRRIAVTILPAAVVVIVAAPLLLMLFGAHYSDGATPVLRLMMLALFPGMLLALYVTRCRLENRTGTLALLGGIQAAMMVGGTVLLARPLGLVAVGWSVLVAELLPALLVTPGMIRWLRSANG